MNDEPLDLNFWPAFSDAMLMLVLIVTVILAYAVGILGKRGLDARQVRIEQASAVDSIIVSLHGARKAPSVTNSPDSLYIVMPRYAAADFDSLFIERQPQYQRITFSERVLFAVDRTEITPGGQDLLENIGGALRPLIEERKIKEIQIEGHADSYRSRRFGHMPAPNMSLASERAIAVLLFLREKVGIDPSRYVMSATSFGHFMPASRSVTDFTYDSSQVWQANATDELRRRNRRIEMKLVYRFDR